MVLEKDHRGAAVYTYDTPDLNPVGSYVTIDFIAGACENLSNGLDRNSTGCRVPIVSCRGMSSDL